MTYSNKWQFKKLCEKHSEKKSFWPLLDHIVNQLSQHLNLSLRNHIPAAQRQHFAAEPWAETPWLSQLPSQDLCLVRFLVHWGQQKAKIPWLRKTTKKLAEGKSKGIEHKDPEATASWGSLSSANGWKLWAISLPNSSVLNNCPCQHTIWRYVADQWVLLGRT